MAGPHRSSADRSPHEPGCCLLPLSVVHLRAGTCISGGSWPHDQLRAAYFRSSADCSKAWACSRGPAGAVGFFCQLEEQGAAALLPLPHPTSAIDAFAAVAALITAFATTLAPTSTAVQ